MPVTERFRLEVVVLLIPKNEDDLFLFFSSIIIPLTWLAQWGDWLHEQLEIIGVCRL
jgi:hypothetical protein